MKKLILLIASGIFIISAYSNNFNNNSKLKLKMWDLSTFSVVFDGQMFANQSNYFVATNLASGNHKLKVIKHVYSGYGRPLQKIVVFSGFIHIPANSKVNAKINRFNELQISEIEYFDNYYNSSNYNGNCSSNYNNNYYENPYEYNNCSNYMTNSRFNQLKNSISNIAFDSSRLKVAKQAVSTNILSSNQVYELCKLLTFESSKLELAKFAYSSVNDKENYYIVNNAFDFSSSIDELNNYCNHSTGNW